MLDRSVCFIVNFGGQDDASIERINAQFVEMDSGSFSEQYKKIKAFPIPPSMIVRTQKSLHVYWFIDKSAKVSEFRKLQKRLVKYFDGDPACVNESRAMHLPGFNHCKLEKPVKVVCIEFHLERRYTQEQLAEILPDEESQPVTQKSGSAKGLATVMQSCDFIKHNEMLTNRKDGKPGSYSATTIKRTHAVISSILNTAVQWNILSDNPCQCVSTPKQTRNISDVKFFDEEQTMTFLGAVDDQLASGKLSMQGKVLFYLALFCGLRRSELIALKWPDINFKESTISVNKATVLCGKEIVTKSTKNKSSNRVVSVPESVMQLLKTYKNTQQKFRLSLGSYWKGENYIFIQADGKQMYPSTPYSMLKRVIRTYNQTATDPLPDIPFHGLRHTNATLLIGNSVDVKTVSGRLGHAQTSTTMNIYAHSLAEVDRKAAETLDNLLVNRA